MIALISLVSIRQTKTYFRFKLLLGMTLLALINCVHAAELSEIKKMAKMGAVDLSIQILEQQQDRYFKQAKIWMSWERERIGLYQTTQAWQKIATRLATLPKQVDNEFTVWARTQRAKALIRLHQGEAARHVLRSLVWQTDSAPSSQTQLSAWQHLIIDAYLVDGFAKDAQMASVRLVAGNKQYLEIIIQRARMAIISNQTKEALTLLKPFADNVEVAALRLIAQLRGQHREAKHIIQAVYRYVQDEDLSLQQKINLWAVASEAAKQNGNRKVVAHAIEHVLVDQSHLSLARSIFKINSDALWNAYIDYALLIANKAQLLIGEDRKWLETAKKISSGRPVAARAMSVFILIRGQSAPTRQQAAELFVELTQKRKQGHELLLALFQNSQHFKTSQAIPVAVRHVLIDVALRHSDIDRAAELMATIDPLDKADQLWQLQRVRMLVLDHQAEAGAKMLLALLDSNTPLKHKHLDRLLQVGFDLQTADQHESAYLCFQKAMRYTNDAQLQREMFYWMADSRKAQARYADAARLYLKSASHPQPERMEAWEPLDRWAQTAHYQAAESLLRAGLHNDAETVFKRLLKVTEDTSRRAALQRALHRLWAVQ